MNALASLLGRRATAISRWKKAPQNLQDALKPHIKTQPYHSRAVAAMAALKPIIRGVVFDMDGTLTVPVIDFRLMRSRIGVPDGQDILDYVNSCDPVVAEKAHAIIKEVEYQALQDMKVMPGAMELCRFLDSRGLPRGLVTRNVLASVDHFHANAFSPAAPFNPAISRECAFPYKPSPAALLHICATWGIAPTECIMVGDSVKDDIVCGNRAGALSILLDEDGGLKQAPGGLIGELKPTHIVHALPEIINILQQHYDLRAPEVATAMDS